MSEVEQKWRAFFISGILFGFGIGLVMRNLIFAYPDIENLVVGVVGLVSCLVGAKVLDDSL